MARGDIERGHAEGLGSYDMEDDAARAYNAALRLQFALLVNFPSPDGDGDDPFAAAPAEAGG